MAAVQSQTGSENAFGGLAQAAADNIPILFLPDGNPLSNVSVRPNFSAARTYQGAAKRVEPILSLNQRTGGLRSGMRDASPPH